MTAIGAGTKQSTPARRAGRIIERPRLIQQLDAAESPVILIVGPAGYGKTTLARQWARTLTGVIWVSCTPAHRDVVTFAEDVAAGIDALGGNASRFIGEYMRARSNPQRAAREIGQVLAKKLNEAPVQWLVIDDYQELAESPEAAEMVAVLRHHISARILVASRARPEWVKARQLLYAEVVEVGTNDLALTADEASAVVGTRPELAELVRRAEGWPAVVALAARLTTIDPPAVVASTLHQYVADELFGMASPELQQRLIDLALLPDLSPEKLERRFGSAAESITSGARGLGFITGAASLELHPLLRDFLLTKLAEGGDIKKVHHAIDLAIDAQEWAFALDLVMRFDLDDLVDGVVQAAFAPLVRSGRLETLSTVAQSVRASSTMPPPAVDVIEAEVALRDGDITLAQSLARRAMAQLPAGHKLRCRAGLIAGRAGFFLGAFDDAAHAYAEAAGSATDEIDEMEAAFGVSSVQVFAERGESSEREETLAELRRLRHSSTTHLLRYATAELNARRFTGFGGEIPMQEALHVLSAVPDPHVRTAFTYTSGYLLALRADYRRAEKLLDLFKRDVDVFDLDFARPFLDWTQALVDLGLRRFGEADRRLQRVEDTGAERHQESHDLNARLLRARLMLQTGESGAATDLLSIDGSAAINPSWRAELEATRALVLACTGHAAEARLAADAAGSMTAFVEIAVLAEAARAVAGSDAGDTANPAHRLFDVAARYDVWDPVIVALRASDNLTQTVASDTSLRPALEKLLRRAGDTSLARRTGLRTRTNQSPNDVLSNRELEVIGLMAHGMRNKEIAAALFVAESTVKVHVRHILEKLGVRTRAAAVARWERTKND